MASDSIERGGSHDYATDRIKRKVLCVRMSTRGGNLQLSPKTVLFAPFCPDPIFLFPRVRYIK